MLFKSLKTAFSAWLEAIVDSSNIMSLACLMSAASVDAILMFEVDVSTSGMYARPLKG